MPVQTGIQPGIDMDSRVRGNDTAGGREIAAPLALLAMT